MLNKHRFSVTMNIILFVIFVYSCATCSAQEATNDVEGTMKLMDGINELLEAGREMRDPWQSIFRDTLRTERDEFINEATPKLEQLYDQFFNTNSTLSTSPISIIDNTTEERNTENVTQADEGLFIADEARPETHPQTTEIITTSSAVGLLEITSEMNEQNTTDYAVYNNSYNNNTFEYMLTVQNELCYKLKDGITSLSNSDLVVLLMKFLKYDFLVAKEAWERLKITTDRVWSAAITNDVNQTYGSRKVTQFFRFLNTVKEDIKFSLQVLKVPFAMMMRGIKNKYKISQPNNDMDIKDFCMRINDAERKIRDAILSYEKKFSNTLDSKIKEETEILAAAKDNPEMMSLVNKDTISKDLSNVKDNIYKMYDYLRNAAKKHLDKLLEFVKLKEKTNK